MTDAGAVTAVMSASAFLAFLALNLAMAWRYRARFMQALLGAYAQPAPLFAPTGESNVIPLQRAVVRPASPRRMRPEAARLAA